MKKSLNEIKSDDAKYDLFTFDEAVSEFGSNLPTKDDWEELKTECVWTWNGSGYKVTGDNGNTILLPASGYRNCYGRFIYEGSGGFFWSSTPNGLTYAWRLDFDSAYIRLHIGGCCNKGSVRLVQK